MQPVILSVSHATLITKKFLATGYPVHHSLAELCLCRPEVLIDAKFSQISQNIHILFQLKHESVAHPLCQLNPVQMFLAVGFTHKM